MLQTSFGLISINSSMVSMVSIALGHKWRDLSIDANHISKQLILAEVSGKSVDNYYGTIY